MDQDEEFCEVEVDGATRRIRFHDYAEIFKIPGMYEQLFAEALSCNSPHIIATLLADEMERAGEDTKDLRVLDFGAGNGMVAEELEKLDAESIVGVDLLPEAREAAERDRPGLYDDYVAADLTALGDRDRKRILDAKLNGLTCVAALGFGDVPAGAFATAFNLVDSPGWVAFNIRDRFVDEPSSFSTLLERAFAQGILVERARVRYTHRQSVTGDPLEYLAIVARKRRDIPASLLREV